MNWKIVLTASIILIAAFVLVARTPEVTGFFISIYDYVDVKPANVSFSYSTEDYENLTLSSENSEIFITPINIELNIPGGNFTTDRSVALSDFRGTITIRKNTAEFEGTIKKLATSDFSLNYDNQFITGRSTFDSLSVENTSMPFLISKEGTMIVKGTTIDLSNEEVKITTLYGNFTFGSGLTINGRASKIEIPDSGLAVG
jgi:hypothetical protein